MIESTRAGGSARLPERSHIRCVPRVIGDPVASRFRDPTTYLPIRIVIGGLRQDYRWLEPTAANQAKLKVRIPPGFRRVKNTARPSN